MTPGGEQYGSRGMLRQVGVVHMDMGKERVGGVLSRLLQGLYIYIYMQDWAICIGWGGTLGNWGWIM